VGWIADYYEKTESLPVLSQVERAWQRIQNVAAEIESK